jgi:hypothetical protein
MSTFKNITLSEFQLLTDYAELPSETLLTVIFDDDKSEMEILKRKRTFEAMKKLRGSGNGKLVKVLLKERKRDRLR